MERKATDILLSIEEKLNAVMKQYENITFQQTLILKKLQTPSNISAATSLPQQDRKDQQGFKFISVDDDKNELPQMRMVRQQVLYPKPLNQPVINCNIKIYDENRKLINQKVKTNPAGYWSHKFEIGKFYIHITKAEIKDSKPKIDIYFPVDITPGVDVLELEPIN